MTVIYVERCLGGVWEDISQPAGTGDGRVAGERERRGGGQGINTVQLGEVLRSRRTGQA